MVLPMKSSLKSKSSLKPPSTIRGPTFDVETSPATIIEQTKPAPKTNDHLQIIAKKSIDN